MFINRRSLLQGAALAPFALALPLAAQTKLPAVAAGDVEVFRVKVNKRGNWVLVRLGTDRGLTGLGDASQSGDDDKTLVFVKQFANLLRGQSIFSVEWLRGATRSLIEKHGKSAAVAASALEQCIWDIQGKALSLPVYDLFGGRIHDQIRVYANINRSTDPRTPEGFAAMAGRATAASFTAVKLAPFDEIPMGTTDREQIDRLVERGLDCATAVRKTIGPDRDLLVDVHSRLNLEDGLALARRLEPLNLYWLEEVTPATPPDHLARINHEARMPTAGGESIFGVKGFYPYIKADAVDVAMPDIKVCGGMLEMKKIAGLAEGAGLLASPHGPASPVGNIAAAHVIATVPNFNILEFSYGEVPWRAELLSPAEEVASGNLTVSKRPGYGHTLNDGLVAKYAV